VKSGGQIGAPVVTQLHGVMTTHGAEQGLLVAWGGLSEPARDTLKSRCVSKIRPPYATWAYSWISPPSRSRRMTFDVGVDRVG
jgi:hypothetical protein